MVDFATEQVISPQRLAKRLGVSTDTIRRWFRQGLESRKIGGKRFTSLQALNRFSGEPCSPVPTREVEESLEGLKRLGVNVGEGFDRDDRNVKDAGRSQVHSVQKKQAIQP